jgi:serine/threonine protein kinase
MGDSEKVRLSKMIGTDISKYTITKYIASGSFGDVFEAKNKKTGELVALKIPIIKEDNSHTETSLLQEMNVYKKLSNKEKGIANMKVIKHDNKKILMMDLLGPSLETLLSKNKKFGIKTVTLLAIQMIEIIKHIHNSGYIHRDIKPDNFVIGNDDQNKLYCIDFGLAKKYMRNNEHIKFSSKKKFCGTARYASIAAHSQEEQSRKDDLESIGYILVYLYKGKLPWQGIKEKDKHKRYKLIGEKKKEVTEEELCKNMPKEFMVFLKYVRTLDFDEKPHYSALKRMFEKLYESKNYKTNNLEWTKI